ncbi:MAG: 50S ribosomal protein L11 methyltransferase [Myxococcota bacterium]
MGARPALSDARRNDALLALLARRAPGARVLEIGCSSGLLSCVAARLGARRVVAVEPTEQADTAQALVEASGLGEVVEVQAHVEENRPRARRPRLLQAAQRRAPRRGPVRRHGRRRPGSPTADASPAPAAPVGGPGARPQQRRRGARRAPPARRPAGTHGLDLSPILDGVDALEPYRFFSPQVQLASAPACIADLASAPARAPRSLPAAAPAVHDPGPVGGATVWFEAEYRRRARPRQRARPARPLGPPRARLARGARCVRHLRRGRPHRRRGDRRHPATTATSR